MTIGENNNTIRALELNYSCNETLKSATCYNSTYNKYQCFKHQEIVIY